MRYLLLLGATLLASKASAGIENRHLLPFGETEVLTANAGTAGPASSGAVYYNPAGLAQVTHARISVSGSTYVSSSSETSKFMRIDGTDVPYSDSGFDTVPSALISTIRLGEWTLGYYLLVPETFKRSNKITAQTPNTRSTIIQSSDSSELWGGISAAKYFWNSTALGISVQLIRRTDVQTLGLILNFPSATDTGAVSNAQTRFSAHGLSATFGALHHFNDIFAAGLRLQTPMIGLGGSGSAYQGQQIVEAGALTTSDVSKDDIRTRYDLPLDVTLGSRFSPIPELDLLADLSLQAGSDFQPLEDAATPDRIRTDATFRFNTGILARVSPSIQLGAGYLWNPSGVHSLEGRDEGDSRTDFSGVTGGVYWMPDNVRIGLAAFHLWSRGELIPIEEPGARSEFRVRATGAALTFSYML